MSTSCTQQADLSLNFTCSRVPLSLTMNTMASLQHTCFKSESNDPEIGIGGTLQHYSGSYVPGLHIRTL